MNPKPKPEKLVKVFESLVDGHLDALKSDGALHAATFSGLLDGFVVSRNHDSIIEADKARESLPTLASLLDGYREPHATWAERQRSSADDFNLLEAMGVDCKEICHSRMLAWLLDWRIDEYGTHAQRELGFRLFLRELERRLDPASQGHIIAYADEPSYRVSCEVPGKKSRVDVEIAAAGRFVIHIENKILAPESENETNREWEDLQERAKELGVPRANTHGIFLTLDGRGPKNPDNNGFRPVSWSRIARVFGHFAEQAKPDNVKLFASHYAAAVRKLAASKRQVKETSDAEVMAQRARTVPSEEMGGCATA
jgi:hypothetical protein